MTVGPADPVAVRSSRRITSSPTRAAVLRTGVLCGALAVAGGRQGRKAAARGALSAALAVGAARTVTRAVGIGAEEIRRLPGPRTMSTWALAAGASLEMPRSAIPLGAFALGLSGLEAKAQRGVASPVAGAILGAAAAMITRMWWPLGPLSPESVRRFHPPVSVPPAPDGAGVVLAVNTAAGPKRAPSPAAVLRAALPEARVEELAPGDDLAAPIRAAGPDAVAVGVAGGDGSVNAAAGLAAELGLPLVVVPAGTLNHFARDVGLGSVADAVTAIRRGEVVEADLGTINGRPFLNQASIGGYVELVDARERLERHVGKWPAAAAALLRVLWRSRRMLVDIEGEERCIWMAFIGNCHYVPNGMMPTGRQRLDDGVFDLRLINAHRSWSRTRLVLAALTGRVERSALYEQRLVRRLRIHVREPRRVRFGVDGETRDGSIDLVIEKHPRQLLVYAPHR